MRENCPCKIHGLNPWIKECPYCFTPNPNYTTNLSDEDRAFKNMLEEWRAGQ